jgi:hypothetical protein
MEERASARLASCKGSRKWVKKGFSLSNEIRFSVLQLFINKRFHVTKTLSEQRIALQSSYRMLRVQGAARVFRRSDRHLSILLLLIPATSFPRFLRHRTQLD